jgi:hypothetical protein
MARCLGVMFSNLATKWILLGNQVIYSSDLYYLSVIRMYLDMFYCVCSLVSTTCSIRLVGVIFIYLGKQVTIIWQLLLKVLTKYSNKNLVWKISSWVIQPWKRILTSMYSSRDNTFLNIQTKRNIFIGCIVWFMAWCMGRGSLGGRLPRTHSKL